MIFPENDFGGFPYSAPVGSTMDACFRQFTEAFGVFLDLRRSSSTLAVVCAGWFGWSRYATCCVPFDWLDGGRARRRHWQWYVLAGFAGHDTPHAVLVCRLIGAALVVDVWQRYVAGWFCYARYATCCVPFDRRLSSTTVAWLVVLVLSHLALCWLSRCDPLIVGRPKDLAVVAIHRCSSWTMCLCGSAPWSRQCFLSGGFVVADHLQGCCLPRCGAVAFLATGADGPDSAVGWACGLGSLSFR